MRIAVLGCGRMGQIRAKAAKSCGARIVALVDPDEAVAAALGAEVGANTVMRSADDLPWSSLDAVFVCTPPHARGEVERTALRHGVAIFVEKPIALSADAVWPLVAALAQRPIVNAVGYMNRYRPSVLSLRDALCAQRPIGFQARWVNGAYRVPWWSDTAQSGGSLNEQATHFIDLVRFLLGEIAEVCVSSQPHPDYPALVGSAAILLTMRSGAVGSMNYSCCASYKAIAFSVATEHQEVELTGWELAANNAPAPPDRNAVFREETERFLIAASGGENRILSTLADAACTQVVADAIQRAARTGQRVAIAPENETFGRNLSAAMVGHYPG